MEEEAWAAIEPVPDGSRVMSGQVVQHDVDDLPRCHLLVERVREKGELLLALAVFAAADDRAVQHVQGGEQRGSPVALGAFRAERPVVVVAYRPDLAPFERQAGLGAIERLDLTFFVDGHHHGMLRRVDVQPDDIAHLAGEIGVSGELKGPETLGLEIVVSPDGLDRFERNPDIAGRPPARRSCPIAWCKSRGVDAFPGLVPSGFSWRRRPAEARYLR